MSISFVPFTSATAQPEPTPPVAARTTPTRARARESRPPGPRGARARFRWLREFQHNPFRLSERLREQHGDLAYVEFLGLEFFFVYAPETVDRVLAGNAANYRKDRILRGWDELFGNGLLTADHEDWRRSRRLVQPAFHRDRIASYRAVMESCASSLSSGLKPGRVAIQRRMMGLALDIAARTLFGCEIPADVVDRVATAFGHVTRYFEATNSAPGHLTRKWPLPINRRYRRAVRELDAIVLGLVAERQSRPRAADDPPDLVSALLEARDHDRSGLTTPQLRDELVTLFLAGHETTALALTSTLFLLAHHPEIQERVARGLEEQSTELLGKVIREALRLFPPAWALGREAIEDDRLAGYRVPAGSSVVIPIWAIHRDPRHFAEPLEFHPERWTPELERDLPRTAYLPFGHGARMCVGAQFALTELEVVLSRLLRRWRIRPSVDTPAVEELELQGSITARPKREIFLELEERQS